MIPLLKQIFLDNWIRKIISFFIAIILWFIVNDTLTKSKNYTSINTNIIEEIK